MAIPKNTFLVIIGFLATFSIVLAKPGIASFYNSSYVPSKCYGTKPQGDMVAKVGSKSLWNGGAICGKNFNVTCTGETNKYLLHPCTGKSVVVKIVDYCPECTADATFYLPEKAFETISMVMAFEVKIDYVQ
ncbi:EG45-like domain containing protein [Solanum tuberosum]|nr:PREDICTED: EG45-like domain containing protein [Solanum tuberosum]